MNRAEDGDVERGSGSRSARLPAPDREVGDVLEQPGQESGRRSERAIGGVQASAAPRRRRRFVLISRGALKRLAILAIVIAITLVAGYVVLLRMPGASWTGPLPQVSSEQLDLADRLRADVEHLAGTIGERSHWDPVRYRQAATWIAEQLRAAGHEVRELSETVEFPQLRTSREVRTIVVELPGSDLASEIIVIGAHYDSVYGSPGANDNASGTAAVLAIARDLSGIAPRRTLRLVLFPDEEPPFFMTDQMGSNRYARACRKRGDDIVAMLSIETIGWYDDTPGSQKYPDGLGAVFPDRGNFIGFVSNVRSRRLLREVIGHFREHTSFPSEGGSLPGVVPGISWSDQWSFWQHDYPGLMVTDTAPFRYPHYHEPTDTPDKLDYERMARVVEGLQRVVRHLAEGGARSDQSP